MALSAFQRDQWLAEHGLDMTTGDDLIAFLIGVCVEGEDRLEDAHDSLQALHGEVSRLATVEVQVRHALNRWKRSEDPTDILAELLDQYDDPLSHA
jgi:hypothetical protein